MEISTDDLVILIGQMQIELFALRRENQILKERLEKSQFKEEQGKKSQGKVQGFEKK